MSCLASKYNFYLPVKEERERLYIEEKLSEE